MPVLESIEAGESSAEEKKQRFSGWKFWLIALVLHALLLVLLSNVGWVIKTGRTLLSQNYDDLPQGVDLDVAIPGAPPGLGLAGPHTPDVKIPNAGVPAADAGPADPNAKVDMVPLQAVIGATGQSAFSMAGRQANAIPGALSGLTGSGRAFGQGGTGNIPAAWGKRFAKNKAQFSDPVTEAAVMKALRWLKDNQQDNGSWTGARTPAKNHKIWK